MKTPKQRVLRVYPNAHAVHAKAAHFWWIHRNAWPKAPHLDNKSLGTGDTAKQAWANAAEQLPRGLRLSESTQ